MEYMKSHLFRMIGLLVAALLFSLVESAPAADKKPKAPKATPSPTDQLESARVATRKLPALAADATMKREKFELRLKVRRVADDWELSIAGQQPMTVVRKDGNYYLSEDGGKTWRPTLPDDDLVSAVMAPLETGPSVGSMRRATYEALGKETVNGVDLLHLRLVPETEGKVDTKDAPEQWLDPMGAMAGCCAARVPPRPYSTRRYLRTTLTHEACRATLIKRPWWPRRRSRNAAGARVTLGSSPRRHKDTKRKRTASATPCGLRPSVVNLRPVLRVLICRSRSGKA